MPIKHTSTKEWEARDPYVRYREMNNRSLNEVLYPTHPIQKSHEKALRTEQGSQKRQKLDEFVNLLKDNADRTTTIRRHKKVD
jgi:hypothetical protein